MNFHLRINLSSGFAFFFVIQRNWMISFISLFLFSYTYSQTRKVIEKAHPDGKPSLVIFYNADNEKIREVSYFSNGNMDYDGIFKNGKEHGKWTYYYEDGQKKFEENYKNGLEEGKQYEWEPDGQLTKIEVFKEGRLLKTIPGKAAENQD